MNDPRKLPALRKPPPSADASKGNVPSIAFIFRRFSRYDLEDAFESVLAMNFPVECTDALKDEEVLLRKLSRRPPYSAPSPPRKSRDSTDIVSDPSRNSSAESVALSVSRDASEAVDAMPCVSRSLSSSAVKGLAVIGFSLRRLRFLGLFGSSSSSSSLSSSFVSRSLCSAVPTIRLNGSASMIRMDNASSIVSSLCTLPRNRSTWPLKLAFAPFGLLECWLDCVVNGLPGNRGSAPLSSISTLGLVMGTPRKGSSPRTPKSITCTSTG